MHSRVDFLSPQCQFGLCHRPALPPHDTKRTSLYRTRRAKEARRTGGLDLKMMLVLQKIGTLSILGDY